MDDTQENAEQHVEQTVTAADPTIVYKQALSDISSLNTTITGYLSDLREDAPMVTDHPLLTASLLKLSAMNDIIVAALQ